MISENLNNYGFLAQRGLSSALSKTIYNDHYLNASLFTINEVSKSVLKRSHVSVSLEQNDEKMKVCGVSFNFIPISIVDLKFKKNNNKLMKK